MKNCVFEKYSRKITNTFKISSYICNAKSNVVNTAPSSTRIDAQYEIGLFLCPSVNHIVGIHELAPNTTLAIFAICNKCIRLSFPHYICSAVNTLIDLAITGNGSRSCILWVQENLPDTAKSNAVCYI